MFNEIEYLEKKLHNIKENEEIKKIFSELKSSKNKEDLKKMIMNSPPPLHLLKIDMNKSLEEIKEQISYILVEQLIKLDELV